jgi:SlyX protein
MVMDERLVTLEVRYTHLERQIEELSQVVFQQQKLVDRLTTELASVRKAVTGVRAGSGDEPPPHY